MTIHIAAVKALGSWSRSSTRSTGMSQELSEPEIVEQLEFVSLKSVMLCRLPFHMPTFVTAASDAIVYNSRFYAEEREFTDTC